MTESTDNTCPEYGNGLCECKRDEQGRRNFETCFSYMIISTTDRYRKTEEGHGRFPSGLYSTANVERAFDGRTFSSLRMRR
ncbi:hypothetical protein BMS3Abin17_00861 [archaeon BMS3Abin17]|nr:hypothetical protein BMS3Abin17_00861 [archaeon BMS3Abin17]HDZ61344.1 hypothetical protein [Candidatus Pacearchaeota archaeon]